MNPAAALSDVAGITQRNLRHIARTPQLLVSSLAQPILFVLLFRYVFGGAIKVPGGHYVNYLLPGIFVQVTLFSGTASLRTSGAASSIASAACRWLAPPSSQGERSPT